MRLPRSIVCVGLIVFLTAHVREAVAGDAESAPVFDIKKRVPWTTSHVVGRPDPPAPYHPEVAFPTLKFDEPLALSHVKSSDKFLVAERKGKIFAFDNDRKKTRKQLVVDVGRTVYGLAVHPKFAENGYFYTVSVTVDENPTGTRLSRFQVSERNPLKANADSEVVLLEWPSGGHNGGCLKFGPDGFLYIVTGDGSGIADEFHTGQDISDLLGSMLRIDVDHSAEGKLYGIPADNPFVNVEVARPEVYAYGLRQSWRFSFDQANGRLWSGEVGQDLWEMVLIIEKGGNYGWSVMEGFHPFRPERTKGPTPILPPLVEHPHSDFRSLTGGYVYHGERLPELKGAYIYGDYDTGRVWMLRYDGTTVTDRRELADTEIRLVEFAQDARGEVYLVDFAGGKIQELVPTPPVATGQPDFPRKLSETGLFMSTRNHTPAAGVIPYSVNAPLWSDGAEKERFLALPGDSQIEYEAVVYPQPAPGSQPGWRFPDGTVLVKTFSIDMEAGNATSRKRLETRILHHQKMPGNDDEYGAQMWHGYTYVWNDDQTDAELLDAQGLDRKLTIADASAPGGMREQTWHFPSRAECTLCHTMAAKYVLGVTTLQMNKEHVYGHGVVANQLDVFAGLGLFTKPLPDAHEKLAKLPDYHDAQQSLDDRARAYLHANCSHCHRKWGGGNAEFQLLAAHPLAELGVIDVKPGQGKFDLDDPRILVPGNPDRSMILHRMQKTGLGRMPHVASTVIDAEGVELVREWIAGLKSATP